jgi:hypothetical protein
VRNVKSQGLGSPQDPRALANRQGTPLGPHVPVALKLKGKPLLAQSLAPPPQNAKMVEIENAKTLPGAVGRAEPQSLKSRALAVQAAPPNRYSISESKSEPASQSKPESAPPPFHQFGVPERFSNMQVDAPKVLAKEPLAREVRGSVSKPVETDRASAQLQLMKGSLGPIMSATKGKDPRAVSIAVADAKRVQANYLASLPSPPKMSEAELDLEVQKLMTAALRQRPSDTTSMHLALIGKSVYVRPGQKPVIESDENELWKVANRSFNGLSKDTRQETSNVKLVRLATAEAMRASK